VLTSILLHVLIATLLLVPLRHDFARVLTAGDPRAGEGRAGGGGGGAGGRAYISLPAPPRSAPVAVEVEAPPSAPVPSVTPTVPPVEVPPAVVADPVPPEPVAAAAVAAPSDSSSGQGGAGPGAGGGAGGGTGGGFGPGTGTGVGPGTGTGKGEGGAARPPMLRHQVIPPENAPKELRGVDLTVTFWVTETGTVARVEVAPPIKDRKFAARFEESMMQYRFRPGLGPDGNPVASLATHTVTY
jgi:protein TonB